MTLERKHQPATGYLDQVRHLASGTEGRLDAVTTGFQFLDDAMGGWHTGLHLVAGAPGCGKSAFALHAAFSAAQAGLPVLYLGFELEPQILVTRLLCQQSGWDLRDAIEGKIDQARFDASAKNLSEVLSRITLMDVDPLITPQEIEGPARDCMARHKAARCLIIVDYLQLWAAGARDFTEFRHEVAKLTTSLRRLALELPSPVLAISSQSRVGQGEPDLASLEGTSDLEYSADSVTFLIHVERPASQRGYTPTEDAIIKNRSVSINLRKNRFGEPGSRVVKFLPHNGSFDEESMQKVSAHVY